MVVQYVQQVTTALELSIHLQLCALVITIPRQEVHLLVTASHLVMLAIDVHHKVLSKNCAL